MCRGPLPVGSPLGAQATVDAIASFGERVGDPREGPRIHSQSSASRMLWFVGSTVDPALHWANTLPLVAAPQIQLRNFSIRRVSRCRVGRKSLLDERRRAADSCAREPTRFPSPLHARTPEPASPLNSCRAATHEDAQAERGDKSCVRQDPGGGLRWLRLGNSRGTTSR